MLYINHSPAPHKVTVFNANISNNILVASAKWTSSGDVRWRAADLNEKMERMKGVLVSHQLMETIMSSE